MLGKKERRLQVTGRAGALLALPLLLGTVLAAGCAGQLEGNESDYFATYSPSTQRDGGTGGGGGMTPGIGCARMAAIIDANCKVCHGSDGPLGGLDLVSPGLAARLLDQPSSNQDCASKKRIDSATPSASFLLEKLTSSKPTCGDPMPFGSKLNADDIACVTAWVMDVAAGGDGS